MFLLLPLSIKTKELKPVSHNFPLEIIISAAKKIQSGLGTNIAGAPHNTKYVKIALTSAGGAGRGLFLIILKQNFITPVLIRDKKDKVGQNISPKNKEFLQAVEKNLTLIEGDMKNDTFEIINL